MQQLLLDALIWRVMNCASLEGGLFGITWHAGLLLGFAVAKARGDCFSGMQLS